MKTVLRWLWPGPLFLLAAAGSILMVSAAWHVKLFLGLVLALVLPFKTLARWSEDQPSRRRAFFICVLFLPVALLATEVSLAYLDWREAARTKVLRLADESDQKSVYVRSELCSFQFRPSQEWPIAGGSIKIDCNGFRSDYDVKRAKDPGRPRIILSGGSTAFGWTVPEGQDVAGHLRAILNGPRSDGPYEVINAAVPFYGSFQELNLYEHVLHAFHPDILIVLSGRNDTFFAVRAGPNWRPASEGYTGLSPFLFTSPKAPASEPIRGVEALLGRSALYRRYDALFPHPKPAAERTGPPPPPAEVDRAFIDQLVRHWGLLARAAVGDRCRCVLALQPVIHVGKPLTPQEEKNTHLFGGYGQWFRKLWPEVQAAVARVDVPGAVVVDLTNVFAQFSDDAYMDECHYTSEGNRLIAARLAEIIRSGSPAQARQSP